MNKPKRYTLTAALPYANGPLHIGHIAGAYLPADIYARYLRLKGADVAFICGSDEHGAAIMMRAKKEGITPQEVIDKYHAVIRDSFERFGISFDIYHRTSEAIHHQTSQDFFLRLHEKGDFTVEESEQYYDEEAKQFLADRFIVGTCPKCANPNAYGDQCEKCGSALSPSELISPRSTLSGKAPVLRKTRHWYLPMQRHEGWVRQWIEKGILDGQQQHDPATWKKHVLGQCLSWIDGGLQARSMTRDLDWGVKVPLPDAEGKVLYVWLDAPIGYISATKAWAEAQGKNWEAYWKSPDTKLVHFIGKDNIVFHCIIFPILLHAHGEFVLPTDVPANEFLNLEGNKLSTSRNWAVWLHEYMDELPGRTDELRYVLTGIAPETADSEFTWKDYQARVNNELADVVGNLVNRAVVLTHKFSEGKVPGKGPRDFSDAALRAQVEQTYDRLAELTEAYKFRAAQFEVMELARTCNKYLADQKPWDKAHSPEAREEILTNCLLAVAHLAALFQPFLPKTSEKIFRMLGLPAVIGWHEPLVLEGGSVIGQPEILFTKIEDSVIEAQLAKLEKARIAASPVAPAKDTVSFEDFGRMDLRVGTVTHAEKVPKTSKLLKLTIDTGLDVRTVVSGIAEYYSPEAVVGRQVCLLVNLAPRDLKGITSQGMVLMAEDKDGRLTFVSPAEAVSNGSVVR